MALLKLGSTAGWPADEHSVKAVPLTVALSCASCACCLGARRLMESVYICDVLVVLADTSPCSSQRLRQLCRTHMLLRSGLSQH